MGDSHICLIEGCSNAVIARGWCDAHYRRWRRHGDPLAGRIPHGAPSKWLNDHINFEGDCCLPWPFGKGEDGYGRVAHNGSWPRASRIMCILAHGEPPTPDHLACHSCGKGHEACVNPKHLYWGTPLENSSDMVVHGTRLNGEAVHSSKLTAAQVLEIRTLCRTLPQKDVAAKFGISKQRVSKIARRDQWAWLK